MEGKVKKTTGKAPARRNQGAASEVPEEGKTVEQPEVIQVKEEKPALDKNTKGKVSTIQVQTDGKEAKRSIEFDTIITDFWNHKQTTKTSDGIELHLVDYRGNLRWFSRRQIEVTVRRADEMIVDNSPPRKQNYIAFPKYTKITISPNSKCKGCE